MLFNFFELSLACVVKEGEYTVISFWNFQNNKSLCKRERLLWQRDFGEVLCFQISSCYDMLCCHQCQRGRFLDSVVFDVTQMSYQSLDRIYRAQKVSKALKLSTELTRSSKEMWKRNCLPSSTRSSKEMWKIKCLPSSLGYRRKFDKNSVYQAHSVIKGNLAKIVFTELTRSPKGMWQK